MDIRPFRDEPDAKDYLEYIQNALREGTPRQQVKTPEEFYTEWHGLGTVKSTMRAENTDPNFNAMTKIYDVLYSPTERGIR